ncbi:hypothetical protein BKP56_10100 [Marinilactibacillus sp. 15R]|uniref:DUF2188 domain-containing protein n=1 Tax=Marinilactibacillus sp. 15R TaxID=1911586 RepID=UPI00090C1D33|nr:DUF2188 domain-containing protein [Marinilactibacillus sp. 15R]API89586.1 hypothetical protein BKP56_10100 [Marinilactibacillus sp. 15R]
MPWNTNDYPASMKNLDDVVRKKAIDIGNALLDSNYPEDRAIPIAISQAKEWYNDASEKEIRSYKHQENPKKSDKHDDDSNSDLLDNDVQVYFEDNEWKVKTKGAKRPDSTFEHKQDAVDRAKEIAQNKNSNVTRYTKDGKKQD